MTGLVSGWGVAPPGAIWSPQCVCPSRHGDLNAESGSRPGPKSMTGMSNARQRLEAWSGGKARLLNSWPLGGTRDHLAHRDPNT